MREIYNEEIAAGQQPSIAEMEKAIVAKISVSEGQLVGLATRKSRAVADYPPDTGHLKRDRLFIAAPRLERADKGSRHGCRAYTLK